MVVAKAAEDENAWRTGSVQLVKLIDLIFFINRPELFELLCQKLIETSSKHLISSVLHYTSHRPLPIKGREKLLDWYENYLKLNDMFTGEIIPWFERLKGKGV